MSSTKTDFDKMVVGLAFPGSGWHWEVSIETERFYDVYKGPSEKECVRLSLCPDGEGYIEATQVHIDRFDKNWLRERAVFLIKRREENEIIRRAKKAQEKGKSFRVE